MGLLSSVIGGGASIVGGILGGKKKKKGLNNAIRATTEARDDSLAALDEAIEANIADLGPWREVGQRAIADLERMVGDGSFDPRKYVYEDDPANQFIRDEAMKAVNTDYATAGAYGSGARAKALQNRAADLANMFYQQGYERNERALNADYARRHDLSQAGQAATNATVDQRRWGAGTEANIRMRAAEDLGNFYIGKGINSANTINTVTGSINQGIENWLAG